jgi:membrane-associated phospholipid phosphatase
MSRGIVEISIVKSLPDPFITVFSLITQLGDMWFVLLGILAVYWLGQRNPSLIGTVLRDCSYLFALTIGAYSLTMILKHVFMLPRPPGATIAVPPAWLPASIDPVYKGMVTGDGYAFPSGHALKSTVVYGSAALLLTKWKPHRQYLAAAIIVGLVASSRVILGVHYLVDVVAGILFGLVFLGSMNRVTKKNPRRAFAITLLLSLVAVLMSMSYTSGLTVVGTILGLGIWEFNRGEIDYSLG